MVNAPIPQVLSLLANSGRSLTWGRGMEMSANKPLKAGIKVKVCRCDPHSPWQRETNENTNLLVRQYFPKGTDLGWYL
ncbi:transposase [Nitrospira sp. T9]|uniref:transposase n=1 Tax=unclassified Nitrospira TaxID=2652172 RepID=UPI003F9E93CE